MPSGQKRQQAVKSYQKKFASYTDQQIQEALATARKLSRHYSNKFPDVEFEEFFSISLVAIAEALLTYEKKRGKLNTWISHYIYSRFHKYLIRQYRKQKEISARISKFGYFYIKGQENVELNFIEKR